MMRKCFSLCLSPPGVQGEVMDGVVQRESPTLFLAPQRGVMDGSRQAPSSRALGAKPHPGALWGSATPSLGSGLAISHAPPFPLSGQRGLPRLQHNYETEPPGKSKSSEPQTTTEHCKNLELHFCSWTKLFCQIRVAIYFSLNNFVFLFLQRLCTIEYYECLEK